MELVISAVFNEYGSLPHKCLFKIFENYWEFIDKEKYKKEIYYENILIINHQSYKEDIIKFAKKLLPS